MGKSEDISQRVSDSDVKRIYVFWEHAWWAASGRMGITFPWDYVCELAWSRALEGTDVY